MLACPVRCGLDHGRISVASRLALLSSLATRCAQMGKCFRERKKATGEALVAAGACIKPFELQTELGLTIAECINTTWQLVGMPAKSCALVSIQRIRWLRARPQDLQLTTLNSRLRGTSLGRGRNRIATASTKCGGSRGKP